MSKDNPVATYDVAAKHLQIVQACIDHLHDRGATHELKILTGRLQRLALWATPVEPEIAKREQEKTAPAPSPGAGGGIERKARDVALPARKTIRI